MRDLLRFLLKQHLFLLFLFLELIALSLLVRFNSFQSARIFKMRHSIVGGISSKHYNYSKYLSLEEQNRILVKENAQLYNALDNSKYRLSDESFTDSIKMQHFKFIPAIVVNNSVNKQYNFITLNKGKLHGVENDMGVICSNGIVGIVKSSTQLFSTVVPILNRDFFPNARIKSTNFFGYIEWPGINYREVILKDIPLHAVISIGDTVVTSGYTATFPEGIVIGTVTDYEIQEGVNYKITVKLSTDFKMLTHVMVIDNLLKKEQKALEESTTHD